MKKSVLAFQSLLHALGVLVYVAAVAFTMSNAGNTFGKGNNAWTGVAVLMIFVLSAAITGSLVFGRPVWLYLEGRKMEGVKFLIFTLGWLLVLTAVVLAVLALTAQPLK
jgi:hypothetical protein